MTRRRCSPTRSREDGRSWTSGPPASSSPGSATSRRSSGSWTASGARKVSLIAGPGALPPGDLQDLGVARISLGPWSQRIALTALADAGAAILAGGTLPPDVRPLN